MGLKILAFVWLFSVVLQASQMSDAAFTAAVPYGTEFTSGDDWRNGVDFLLASRTNPCADGLYGYTYAQEMAFKWFARSTDQYEANSGYEQLKALLHDYRQSDTTLVDHDDDDWYDCYEYLKKAMGPGPPEASTFLLWYNKLSDWCLHRTGHYPRIHFVDTFKCTPGTYKPMWLERALNKDITTRNANDLSVTQKEFRGFYQMQEALKSRIVFWKINRAKNNAGRMVTTSMTRVYPFDRLPHIAWWWKPNMSPHVNTMIVWENPTVRPPQRYNGMPRKQCAAIGLGQWRSKLFDWLLANRKSRSPRPEKENGNFWKNLGCSKSKEQELADRKARMLALFKKKKENAPKPLPPVATLNNNNNGNVNVKQNNNNGNKLDEQNLSAYGLVGCKNSPHGCARRNKMGVLTIAAVVIGWLVCMAVSRSWKQTSSGMEERSQMVYKQYQSVVLI